MKILLILSGLILAGLPAWSDVTSGTNAASMKAPADGKSAALQINEQLVAMLQGGDSTQADWGAIGTEIDNYQKKFGVTPKTTKIVVRLRMMQLMVAKNSGDDPQRYNILVDKLADDPLPEVKALAVKIVELRSKPIDLKYTALDGREVDLSKMRGKVVLIDFWATWCGPCCAEVPDIVATYKKYHDKGFEVVGVSLDQDKEALAAFTQKNGMTWPQYFDGKGGDNAISNSYGITAIPAMWLIDKKGMLATTEARDGLADRIEKLLAAP